MQLGELIQGEPVGLVRGSGAVPIEGLTDDSRVVGSGFLFIARGGGTADGGRYIDDAVRRGAVAVISDVPGCSAETGSAVAWVRGEKIDQALAGRLAERFYGYPSRKLKLIGVTGTNGKTTTTFLVQHLLREAGWRCGVIGTVFVDDGRCRAPAQLTTPGAVDFSKYLAGMVANGCRAAVAEVSSHALDQGRVGALEFDVGVFTNLTGDHLDYHGTMDRYAAAKAKLFEGLKEDAWAVLNADDAYGQRMAERCKATVGWCSVGLERGEQIHKRAQYRGVIRELRVDQSLVRFEGPWGRVEGRLPLVGRYNVANALGAIAAVGRLIDLSAVLPGALAGLPAVPGRLERVGRGEKPTVLVDYAHTHDALENVLTTLRDVTRGRLTVVFGCGGDRDRTKRPKMAAVACRLADRIIVTSDNPRTEDPGRIIDEVLGGVPGEAKGRVGIEADRAKAIAMAIAEAGRGDIVLLAGKGHEDYQILGSQKYHFDDREQAEAALREWGSGSGR